MDDLLKELRAGSQVPLFDLRQRAADEIERLRRELYATVEDANKWNAHVYAQRQQWPSSREHE